MSGTHKKPSRRVLGGGAGGKSGGSDDDGRGATTKADHQQGCGKKARGVSLFRSGKANNKVEDRGRQKGSLVNSQCWGGGGGGGGGGRGGCCLCVKRPMTAESPGKSSPPTSDPNSAEFSFDMLRGLIEKNDFYDKACNAHSDEEDVDNHVPSGFRIKKKL